MLREKTAPAMPYSAIRCISAVRMITSSGNKSEVPKGRTEVCSAYKRHQRVETWIPKSVSLASAPYITRAFQRSELREQRQTLHPALATVFRSPQDSSHFLESPTQSQAKDAPRRMVCVPLLVCTQQTKRGCQLPADWRLSLAKW